MSRKNLIISLVLNIAIVIMEIIGAIESARTHGTAMLQFYTEDSNLLALVASTLCIIFTAKALSKGLEETPKWVHIFKYISVCCLTVTFIVVIFVLAPMQGANGYYIFMLKGSMLYHHFLCPVVAFVSFIFFEGRPKVERKFRIIALIPTILYAIATVFLNILKVMEGPYPFLRVYQQPVFMSVIWCVVIIGSALLISSGIRALNAKITKK